MKTNVIYIADTSAMEYRPGPVIRTWKRQFKAALRALAPPEGPRWFRLVSWWVATPSGLFANFFTWFVGIHAWGPLFFVGWLFFSLFIPCAVVYRRNLKAESPKRR